MAESEPSASKGQSGSEFLSFVEGRLRDSGWKLSVQQLSTGVYALLGRREGPADVTETALAMVPTGTDVVVGKKHVKWVVKKGVERDAKTLAVVTRGEFTGDAVEMAEYRGVTLLESTDVDELSLFADTTSGLQEGSKSGREAESNTQQRPAQGDHTTNGEERTGGSRAAETPITGQVREGERVAAHEDGSDAEETLDNALKYPMNEAGWWKTFVLGVTLEVLGFLIVPLIILQGYYVRVLRRTLAGDPEPPSFGQPRTLLVNGLKTSVISGTYSAVPILVFLGFFFAALDAGNGLLLTGRGFRALLLGLFWSLLIAAVFSYIGAAGLARFAHTGKIRSAFGPTVLNFVLSGTWFLTWLKIGVISLGLAVVGVILSLLSGGILGIVLGPVKVKYLGTVAMRMVGETYRQRVDVDSVPDT